MLVQDGTLASCGWWRWEGPHQGYNFTSGTDLVRSHGAPPAALPFSLLNVMCNELHRYALHGACSTASLLHVRGMLALDLACLLCSWWQVLRRESSATT